MIHRGYQAILSLTLIFGVLVTPLAASAHRSGCHTLHTCPSDSNTYTCGDLGYPCDGSTSIKDISLSTIDVPLLIEVAFEKEFGRRPTDTESQYWKKRFRSDKNSIHKIRRVMAWHHSVGSFGPKAIAAISGSKVAISRINSLFREAYDGRNPTVSENQYWITRIADKKSEEAMKDAMLYHKLNQIKH